MAISLVVDASPLVSTLLGGRAKRVVRSPSFELFAPQFTLFEVEKHITRIAEIIGVAEMELFEAFQLLPIAACQPADYDGATAQAMELIGRRDPNDVPVLALAIARGLPLWSDDSDFAELPGVTVFRTAQLLAWLDRP